MMGSRAKWTIAFGLSVFLASAAFGWGNDSHRAAVRGAIPTLPEGLRPFFLTNREFIAEHSLDPDYLPDRTVEQKAEHFLDLDAYGAYPFARLSHSRAELEKEFGGEKVIERGLLPWTIWREHDRLVRAFQERNWAEARMAAAHLAHFVADCTMPLHATLNHDGKLTGNDGIHFRVEVGLVGRYHNSAFIAAGAPFSVPDPTEWAFQELTRGWTFASLVMQGDTEARRAGPLDGDAYMAALEQRLGPAMDARLRDAATAVSAFFTSAWEKAGRPAVPPAVCTAIVVDLDATEVSGANPAEEIARRVAQASGPFDAVALALANCDKRLIDATPRIAAADEVRRNPFAAFARSGRIAWAFDAAIAALEQFPGRDRRLILVTDGWSDEPLVAQRAARLAAMKASVRVYFVGGQPAQTVERFAADAAGRVTRHAGFAAAMEALAGDYPPAAR